MKVAKGTAVELVYSLHLGDGKAIDESDAESPLLYLHGEGQIVPGLEAALEGLSTGDRKQVVVAAKDGYGEHEAEAVQEVPATAFPRDVKLEPGMEFFTDDGEGNQLPVTVREVKAHTVVIDLNHPLAGKALHFDVTVKSVRAATAEELAHGHAHGPDGHEGD